MNEHELFEKSFPPPPYVEWSDKLNDYTYTDFRAIGNVCKYSGQWQAWQAARAQWGAEPVGQITTEMKIECMGEFSWQEEAPYYDEDGEIHDYVATHVVPWDVCKDIYKRMAKFAPTQPPSGVPEGWELNRESEDRITINADGLGFYVARLNAERIADIMLYALANDLLSTNATPPRPESVPKGWKLVPIDPTDKMRDAAQAKFEHGMMITYQQMYRAMLDAAPKPTRTGR